MSVLDALLSVIEFPADPELDARAEASRNEAIGHQEGHRCYRHPVECETCWERVFPEGSWAEVARAELGK